MSWRFLETLEPLAQGQQHLFNIVQWNLQNYAMNSKVLPHVFWSAPSCKHRSLHQDVQVHLWRYPVAAARNASLIVGVDVAR